MDENIVLKYRREFDCWVCGECDIENANTQNTCVVCNAQRPPYPTILKAWSPAEEMPQHEPPISIKPPKPKPKPIETPPRPGPIYPVEPREKYPPETPSGSGMSAALVWLLLFIVLFIVLIILNAN